MATDWNLLFCICCNFTSQFGSFINTFSTTLINTKHSFHRGCGSGSCFFLVRVGSGFVFQGSIPYIGSFFPGSGPNPFFFLSRTKPFFCRLSDPDPSFFFEGPVLGFFFVGRVRICVSSKDGSGSTPPGSAFVEWYPMNHHPQGVLEHTFIY